MTYQRAVLLKTPVLEYSFTLMTQIYKVIHNRSDEQKLQSVMNLIFLNWSDEWLPFANYVFPFKQPNWDTHLQIWLNTNRPSIAATNQVASLMRVANERVV